MTSAAALAAPSVLVSTPGLVPPTPPTPSTAKLDLYLSAANGNDANDGLTPATAVQTTAGIFRVFPRIRFGPVVIHVASGSYARMVIPGSAQMNAACPTYVLVDGAGQPGDNGSSVVSSHVVGGGSTDLVLNVALGSTNLVQGMTLRFTSGAAALQAARRSVGSNTTTTLTPAWRLPTTPAPGDTFNIERGAALFTQTTSYTVAEGYGYGQVDSPLVFVNAMFQAPDRAAQTPVHAFRFSKCHLVLYGCGTQRGGSLELVESYCNAGTLYSWGSQQQRRVGNAPPYGNGQAGSSAIATTALADLGTDPFNYAGWGVQCPFTTGLQTAPLLFDRSAFNGCICAGYLPISSGSQAVLTGGSLVQNGVGLSGNISLETDAYCYIQGSAVQRTSELGAQNAPGTPFRLDSASQCLSLVQQSFVQVDELTAFSGVTAGVAAVGNEGGTIYTTTGMGGSGVVQLTLSTNGLGILCHRAGSMRFNGGSLSVQYSAGVSNALEVSSGGYVFGLDVFNTNGNISLGSGCKVACSQGVSQTWTARALTMSGRSEIDFSQSGVGTMTLNAGAGTQCLLLDQGAAVILNNVALSCTGLAVLSGDASSLSMSGNIGASLITSTSTPALRIGAGCSVNLSGATAGTFTCTSTAGSTGVRCQGSFSFVNARVAISGTATGIDFSLGGRVYSAGQPTNVTGPTQDFLDEQGGFADTLLNAQTCVFTGQHPAGVYAANAPTGSGFVQRLS